MRLSRAVDRGGRRCRDARRASFPEIENASHRIDWRCGAARSSGAKSTDRSLLALFGELARELGAERTTAACRAIAANPGAGNDVDGDGRDRSSRGDPSGAARTRRGRSIGDDWRRRFLHSCGARAEGIAVGWRRRAAGGAGHDGRGGGGTMVDGRMGDNHPATNPPPPSRSPRRLPPRRKGGST